MSIINNLPLSFKSPMRFYLNIFSDGEKVYACYRFSGGKIFADLKAEGATVEDAISGLIELYDNDVAFAGVRESASD